MAPAPKHSAEKQQELILNAAAESISESSITDFTMAKVARLAGLSMGSVYKFVQSKEDMVLALACQSFEYASSIFATVLNLPLSAPEKIVAISLIAPKKMQRFEFDYELQSYSTNEAVIRRASPMWTDKILKASESCEQTFKISMTEGIAAGELKEVPNLSQVIEDILISSWSMAVGYEMVRRVKQTKEIVEGTATVNEALEIDHPIIRSLIRLLNSYPWQQPIDDESLVRIQAELTKLDLR